VTPEEIQAQLRVAANPSQMYQMMEQAANHLDAKDSTIYALKPKAEAFDLLLQIFSMIQPRTDAHMEHLATKLRIEARKIKDLLEAEKAKPAIRGDDV
jgi:hypothetical protein